MSEVGPEIEKFCTDPEKARLFAREAIVLSLACRLNEEMRARDLTTEQLAAKALLTHEDVKGILEGLEWIPAHVTLSMVARLFWAMDLQVEIDVRPLPGKEDPVVRLEEDFRRVWEMLADAGCCDGLDGAEYVRVRNAWLRVPSMTWRETAKFIQENANVDENGNYQGRKPA